MLACVTDGPEATRDLGAAIAALLEPGDVVVLDGDLGAGKTCLVQGAAAALGVGARVTSPSFVLMRSYEGRVPVVHVDVYRLSSLQELIDLGYETLFDSRSVLFIEWGAAVGSELPEARLHVRIESSEGDARRIELVPQGPSWLGRGDRLAERVAPWRAPE